MFFVAEGRHSADEDGFRPSIRGALAYYRDDEELRLVNDGHPAF